MLEFGVDVELGELSVFVVGNGRECFVDIAGLIIDSSDEQSSLESWILVVGSLFVLVVRCCVGVGD